MIEELISYVKNNNLESKTLNFFWNSFNDWRIKKSNEYKYLFYDVSINEIEVFLQEVSFRILDCSDLSCSYVVCTVLLHIENISLISYNHFYNLENNELNKFEFNILFDPQYVAFQIHHKGLVNAIKTYNKFSNGKLPDNINGLKDYYNLSDLNYPSEASYELLENEKCKIMLVSKWKSNIFTETFCNFTNNTVV
jgi:hypothetical protein